MDGIIIGKSSMGGTGYVVVKDVPPYTIIAVVPAKPVRKMNNTVLNLL